MPSDTIPVAGPAGPSSRAAAVRAPGFAASAARIFELTIGQMLWSRRTVFMALIVGVPLVVAVVARTLSELEVLPGAMRSTVAGPTLFGLMVWVFYVRFIVPVLAVFYGTALIADEVEDRTITYLFTRPVRRGAVLAGKYLAYLTCTALVVLPSVLVVYFLVIPIGGAGVARTYPALVADLGILLMGLVAYGALFALVGATFRRSLIAGLLFLFAWEPAVLVLPGAFKRVTVAYYLQGLVPHAMPQDGAISMLQAVFREVPSLPVSLLVLTGLTVVCLALAGRAVEGKEYIPDR